jgi:ribosomal protein S18 acetylase RimI-like enzyme
MRQITFQDETDKQRMSALVHQFPADNLHVADLPYRLSSWAFDDPDNVRLWFDDEEQLVGWAVLQTPFWTIDYAYNPNVEGRLHPEILAWADNRARQVVNTPSGRPIWFINVFSRQKERMADLEAVGFASQADVGENSWTKVLMARPADMPLPDISLPRDWEIRPLTGQAEVGAYVALHRAVFESNSMREEWRSRVLQQPDYLPQLDLVAATPAHELAAFCVCWFDQAGPEGCPCGQIEPLGVHAAYRGQGLGKALLAEGIRRLRELGAEQIFVETDNYRNAALALYESVGFHIEHEVLVYRKDYPIEEKEK